MVKRAVFRWCAEKTEILEHESSQLLQQQLDAAFSRARTRARFSNFTADREFGSTNSIRFLSAVGHIGGFESLVFPTPRLFSQLVGCTSGA